MAAQPRLSVADAALLGAGMMCVSGAAMFYRQKKTTAFKVRVCGRIAHESNLERAAELRRVGLVAPGDRSHPLCHLQVAYFLSWPVLGTAILKVGMPSNTKMEQASVRPAPPPFPLARGADPRAH